MHTQCPNCGTVFEASRPDLNRAKGMVRCGKCYTVFDAHQELYKIRVPPKKERSWQAQMQVEQAKHEALGTKPVTKSQKLVVLFLLGLFSTQLIALNINSLLTFDKTRSVITATCNVLGCEVPAPAAPSQMVILQTSMSTPKDSKVLLVITIRVQNQAGFTQPLPAIKVSLGNLIGQPVAAAIFTQEQYLPHQSDQRKLIASSETRDIALILKRPANRVKELSITLL